jgi:solute carrier family 35, member E1
MKVQDVVPGDSSDRRYGTFAEKDVESQAEQASPDGKTQALYDNAITLLLFVLWYILNAWYNIDNKRALQMCHIPWTMALIQLVAGWFWFVPLWIYGLRKTPKVYSRSLFFSRIFPQGFCHLMVHVGAVVAFSEPSRPHT